MEVVDVLSGPEFEPSGEVKPLTEAWAAGDWIGTFNLWIASRRPVPSIILQQRSTRSSWAPGLLDVAAGGHYRTGEEGADGLREAREELGRTYRPNDVTYIGRRTNVMLDEQGRTRRNVVSIFIIEDDTPLSGFVLEETEVHALFSCPIEDLELVYGQPGYAFTANGWLGSAKPTRLRLTRASFPENWDDYHPRMIRIARRFLAGEQQLSYD
jgi:hypothetical protein